MELKQDLSRQPDLRRAISQTQSASLVIPSASVEPCLPRWGMQTAAPEEQKILHEVAREVARHEVTLQQH